MVPVYLVEASRLVEVGPATVSMRATVPEGGSSTLREESAAAMVMRSVYPMASGLSSD
jgi:hypothetical protein